MLPQESPQGQRVSWCFRPRHDSGAWQRLHDTLRAQGRPQAGRLPHPTAGGPARPTVQTPQLGGERGCEKGQNVKGRKRHLLMDTLGLLLAIVVTAASVSDPAGARLLLARRAGAWKKVRPSWVAGAYQGQRVVWV